MLRYQKFSWKSRGIQNFANHQKYQATLHRGMGASIAISMSRGIGPKIIGPEIPETIHPKGEERREDQRSRSPWHREPRQQDLWESQKRLLFAIML